MCGRYQFSADEYKEIRQIVRDAQRRSEGNERTAFLEEAGIAGGFHFFKGNEDIR